MNHFADSRSSKEQHNIPSIISDNSAADKKELYALKKRNRTYKIITCATACAGICTAALSYFVPSVAQFFSENKIETLIGSLAAATPAGYSAVQLIQNADKVDALDMRIREKSPGTFNQAPRKNLV